MVVYEKFICMCPYLMSICVTTAFPCCTNVQYYYVYNDEDIRLSCWMDLEVLDQTH